VEIDGWIPRIIGRRRGRGVRALKTLQTRPRLEHGPIDGEGLVRHQARLARLMDHRVEERAGDIRLQQPVAILAERRRRPDRLVQAQPDEPPNRML
jgi:hypothetical protein